MKLQKQDLKMAGGLILMDMLLNEGRVTTQIIKSVAEVQKAKNEQNTEKMNAKTPPSGSPEHTPAGSS